MNTKQSLTFTPGAFYRFASGWGGHLGLKQRAITLLRVVKPEVFE